MTKKIWTSWPLGAAIIIAGLTGYAATPAPKAAKKASPGISTNKVAKAESAPARALIQPEPGLVKQDHVNVRGQAGIIGEVITHLRKGDKVMVLQEITLKKTKEDEPARWYKIAMPINTPLWVSAQFVDATNHVVSSKKLNIRGGPTENHSIVGTLEKGAEIKEISRTNEWVEIESPTNAFGFVAAEFIARQAVMAPETKPFIAPEPKPVVPEPSPVLETKQEPPVEKVASAPEFKPAAGKPLSNPEPEPVIPQPLTENKVGTPVETSSAPLRPAMTSTNVSAELPKRIVQREGIVKKALSIQAPTYFELVSEENGRVLNYLHTTNATLRLKEFTGFKVVVTGEEGLDRRWPNTPVVEIETLELP